MVKKTSLMEDPIMQTLVAAIAALMAKITNLIHAGDYQAALSEVDKSLEEHVGLKADQLRNLDDAFIIDLLTVNEFLDLQRLWILAELFFVRGEIKIAQGQKKDGVENQIRSLSFLLEVAFASAENIQEVNQRIHKLFIDLQDQLPEETLFSLYDYFEKTGNYQQAEASLDWMLNLTGNDPDLLEEKREFLKRIALKSNQAGDFGNLPYRDP